ncbi:uncharacterized protein DUF397 [Herbihabitans rhizosphaerae]|uniref:Uncharacterized protein DUF397 n=1 Tax=Herbihabitans rhizosphaerae TaxID=1872711 RepID=A0A4Q7KHN5_9PSEU|nr:DUF397 domain-containing protein [Herbihabitans rhizosphaerae]RZS32767.1 uncharacterized protein DUF397 [Herbihabitans rhizosphaerae]
MTVIRPDFASATFKTSTFTEANGTCVEVAVVPGFAAVRDTKHRAGGHLSVPAPAFADLLSSVRAER